MIWKIFARLPGYREDTEDYASICFQNGLVAVGWNEVGNLNDISSIDQLKKKLLKFWPEALRGKQGNRRLASWATSLWDFRTSVKKGDFILCPDRNSDVVYGGIVLSDLYFDDSRLGGHCSFAHRRRVKWYRRLLDRNDVDSIWGRGLQFGGLQTVARVHSDKKKVLRMFSRRPRAPRRIRQQPNWKPDAEWGRKTESRAMQWLRRRGTILSGRYANSWTRLRNLRGG